MNPQIQITISDGPLGPCAMPREGGSAGAVVQFEGVVRGREQARDIAGLNYQTYDPMAEQQLRRLADKAAGQFGLALVHVEHSRGFVPVGECSFRLIVASAHRKESLAAMDWFIDALKQDVPIWKQAVFTDEPAAASREGQGR